MTYLFLLFSFFWGNVSYISHNQAITATHGTHISHFPIDRMGMIKQAVVKTWQNMRRRGGWWSELLTITAIMWGIGVLLKIGSWLVLGSWADLVATLLFIGGGVFFVIWFFQMAGRMG